LSACSQGFGRAKRLVSADHLIAVQQVSTRLKDISSPTVS
jgi:hypothetical protein